ncbi:MAG: V-type ATP synthase subunit A, partial [Gammaproteobacteria bacterium]|nr:V-type ATP synthase subunit A [Gammaproteobacteria bacterium]
LDGPVVRARSPVPFSINEAVEVGDKGLLGEVLRISGEVIVVQVYEDTAGLQVGDRVQGTGQPLSVQLGPWLLGGIFDGLLRPLNDATSAYVHPGRVQRKPQQFHFQPRLQADAGVHGGSVLGDITSPQAKKQLLLAPPQVQGKLVMLAPAGDYPDDEILCRVRQADGGELGIAMTQSWPVRIPRPAAQRLAAHAPLLTGQRLIDVLFPVARGSSAAMPGGFGTGKTILQQSIAKWCDADVIVYVGCGERGNEMAEVLEQFPQIEDPRSHRPLLERSVIIANTSNMPVAAREASIYTGVTVAEYFRDQGLHVALMADSTSRWAEALRELGGRLGELPAEGGYPAYLGSRQAEFYERAALVRTLSGLTGSVTLIGAVSPPGGDFSEPVTLHTQRNVRCFWPLDRDRARARFYPAINPLQAYSDDAASMIGWWQQQGAAEFASQRRRQLELLEEQAHLARMVRIVGKDALPASQQLTLLCADLVNDAFLRQSAYSKIDCFASPQRQIAMLQLLDHFILRARQVLASGADMGHIEHLPVLRRVRRMGEEISEAALPEFKQLQDQIDAEFAELQARSVSTEEAGVS